MARAQSAAATAAARAAPTVAVSNEVGAGIVPADALSRRYHRDLLGQVNAAWADADHALLLVAGRSRPPGRPAGRARGGRWLTSARG